MQKAAYEWPNPLAVARFKPEHPVCKLEGDYDIFGDGSATILATPGHTPGHQSLLVKLPKTGAVVLSGDAVHFKSNWDNRGVPSGNMPQRPYVPSGTLRRATAYPGAANDWTADQIKVVLDKVGLAHLKDKLEEETAWDQTLSGGEKQRLAFARLLIHNPRHHRAR